MNTPPDTPTVAHAWWARPPWRTLLLLAAIFGVFALAYAVWSPGARFDDGRHDRRRNGMWLQHSWLADDAWCLENHREDRCTALRDPETIEREFARLGASGFRYVYPHLAPTRGPGTLPGTDAEQVHRVLAAAGRHGVLVLPWIGGVWQRDVFPQDRRWRERFIENVVELLDTYPDLAGVHINIEPLPAGDPDLIVLLQELRAAMKPDDILSLAAYPAPSLARTDPDVFWPLEYLAAVAVPVDQLVMMFYDSGYPLPKMYVATVARWTRDVVAADLDATVLLGVPAYDDDGVPWHDPWVENIGSGLRGIHKGLSRAEPPERYEGISLYADWEMDEAEWDLLERRFLAPRPPEPLDQTRQ